MVNTLLASTNGMFAGLLVVMIVLTALFGVILYLLLRPVKKPNPNPIENIFALSAEVNKLLEKEKDEKKHSILEQKLHEIKIAEHIVLVETGHAPHPTRPHAAPAQPAPAAPAAQPQAKPAAPAQHAPTAPAKPAQPANPAPAAQPQAKPAQPANQAAPNSDGKN